MPDPETAFTKMHLTNIGRYLNGPVPVYQNDPITLEEIQRSCHALREAAAKWSGKPYLLDGKMAAQLINDLSPGGAIMKTNARDTASRNSLTLELKQNLLSLMALCLDWLFCHLLHSSGALSRGWDWDPEYVSLTRWDSPPLLALFPHHYTRGGWESKAMSWDGEEIWADQVSTTQGSSPAGSSPSYYYDAPSPLYDWGCRCKVQSLALNAHSTETIIFSIYSECSSCEVFNFVIPVILIHILRGY